MDGYPDGSLDHNVPFMVVSGLSVITSENALDSNLKDQGILVRSGLPALETRGAQVLESHLGEVDERGKSWVVVPRDEPYRFRIRTVGRSFLLPPRRSPRPESSETPPSPPVLHSPFSPLSHGSSLYPDGLIDAQWIKKHQDLVPSILVCFYTISSDPTTTTLQDNRLKNDIADVKRALSKSGYRTRLSVVLLADDDATPATMSSGLQERLEDIRRGSTLDPKSLFYIPPQEGPAELRKVMDGVLAALYIPSIEYYRDIGRHARKKRSRGVAPQPTVPPTSGTSRTLSLPDWNFRYDFKAAVLGEFRQEYESSIKSYEQAYEVLLGQDVLDAIPSWSPRWNEARLLADVIAIRCMRIQFWLGHPNLAVGRWQSHRDRIADFVDRRGRGTGNYGWQAWEARWAMVMAELMDKVELHGLEVASNTLFLLPDRALFGDRLTPWEALHHKGYWYRAAARSLDARRRLALSIPDEDRVPPDALAPNTAGQSYNYDIYLCPEPYEEYPLDGSGVNHAQLILDCLIQARSQFQSRKQLRMAAELSLDCAKEMAKMGSWQGVLSVLRPLWEDLSFRSDGWLDVTEDMCWLIRRAAVEEGRGELVVAVDWELMNKRFKRRPQWHYDLAKSLDDLSLSSKPDVSLTDEEHVSLVDAAFLFRNKESKAGERCTAQLLLASKTFADAPPVTFREVRVEFEGSLKPIVLEHSSSTENDTTAKGSVSRMQLTLEEVFDNEADDGLPSMLRGRCSLALMPSQTRVLELSIPLREAGSISASMIKLSYGADTFDMDYTMKLDHPVPGAGWFSEGCTKPNHPRANAHILQVQPRPPKVDIRAVNLLNQYYANELIELHVQLHNAEEEAATIKLETHLFGKHIPAFSVVGKDGERNTDSAMEESRIPGFPLGRLDSSSTTDVTIRIDPTDVPSTYDLHLRATYHLDSDAATPIIQLLPLQINVASAFEANYDLVPRLHLDPWPSLFDHENVPIPSDDGEAAVSPQGLAQNWSLICHYASFASEDLKVVGIEVKVLSSPSHARFQITEQPEIPSEGIQVSPKKMHETRFDLTAQKLSLEERQPVSLELAVVIRWQRLGADEKAVRTNTTTMVAGQYLVLSSEPRVLASMFETSTPEGTPEELLHLDITIENPSNHFLTFGLTMEPSDEFAFSGAKQTTMHLLPMSRRNTTYRLLPLVRDTYIRPGLVVRDKYFQKVLRIIPTEGMKIDKEGLLVWVPAPRAVDDETTLDTSTGVKQ